MRQAPYRTDASESFIGMELARSDEQLARWYFAPVRVTYTVSSDLSAATVGSVVAPVMATAIPRPIAASTD